MSAYLVYDDNNSDVIEMKSLTYTTHKQQNNAKALYSYLTLKKE